jgi:hypothetical protein
MKKYLIIIALLISCTPKEIKQADKEFKESINKAENYQKITESENISEIRESLFYCSEDLKVYASESRKQKTQIVNLQKTLKDFEDQKWKINLVNYIIAGFIIIFCVFFLSILWKFRKFFGFPV